MKNYILNEKTKIIWKIMLLEKMTENILFEKIWRNF